jgi:hypothetical protein
MTAIGLDVGIQCGWLFIFLKDAIRIPVALRRFASPAVSAAIGFALRKPH